MERSEPGGASWRFSREETLHGHLPSGVFERAAPCWPPVTFNEKKLAPPTWRCPSVKSLFSCICGPFGIKGYLQLRAVFTFPLWTKVTCLLEWVQLVYTLFIPVSQRWNLWLCYVCELPASVCWQGLGFSSYFHRPFPAILIASLKQTNSYILYKTTEHTIPSDFSDALYNDWPKAYPNIMYYGSNSQFFEEER